jgi:hypothetical protein
MSPAARLNGRNCQLARMSAVDRAKPVCWIYLCDLYALVPTDCSHYTPSFILTETRTIILPATSRCMKSTALCLLRRNLQDANGAVFVQLYKIGVKCRLHSLRDQSFTLTG